MDKKVSIIVPVYNVEKYIEATMDSVRGQSCQDWELLLVMDGCTDSTEAVVEDYCRKVQDQRIRIIRQPGNMGAARARNRGLKESKGRYIAFLDSDDLWFPDKLARQLAFMEEKQAAFSFTGYEFADENGKGLGRIVRVPEKMNYQDALKNTTIFTTTVMFDTEKIDRELLKMPQVKSEDTALWWKVLRNGFTAYGLNENLALYRRPGRSLSSNKLEAVKRIWNLYRRVEGLSAGRSMYYFGFWAVRAVKRRMGI